LKNTVIPRLPFLFNKGIILPVLAEKETQEYPLLSELFSIDQLDKHGEAMARLHTLDSRPAQDKLLKRLSENEKILTESYELLAEGGVATHSNSPAAVWLLDNFFLIEEQIQLARQHLPKRYSLELPRLGTGASAGLPRVYSIVEDLISHVDGRVDEENLRTMFSSYQKVTTLKLGELWAIPIMLRLALIENLRRIAMRISSDRRDRTISSFWAARMLHTAENNPKNIVLDIADMARADIPMSSALIADMVRKLHSHNPALALALTWIEQRLNEGGQTIERHVFLDNQRQAINHVAIGNSITSLRVLTSIDWKKNVDAMSRVESILREDPAGIYAKMDFSTRDMYRHIIEKVARQSGLAEESVTSHAIALATEIAGPQTRTKHVGYYLVGHGLERLEQTTGMRLTIRDKLLRAIKTMPMLSYLGMIILLTSSFTVLAIWGIHNDQGMTFWVMVSLLLLGFSQASISLVNWLVTTLIPPQTLPRMDYTNGIPPESRTLVTVPTMLSGNRVIMELLNKVEVHYLSNRADNLYFSLLTDFEDAATETTPDDTCLLELATAGIKRLNDTYSLNGKRPFLLFHRSRQWNPQEQRWMGYERKRGKLETLTNYLRFQKPDSLLVEGDQAVVREIKYVLTLDTDTELPRDCARHLIETMAHPLNAPVFDDSKKRIVDGYTILQPRVVSSLPAIEASSYARIFGSETGIDPYTRAVSDVYQDLFGEGAFIGKGIFDVDAFNQTLANRLPENRILSHDLLEGNYCRSGLVSDIQLIDEFPQRYSEDLARRHRWIRGDWQIAAWLTNRVPGFKEKSVKNPLSNLSRWKIFDNLRRSVVPLGLLLIIITSWLFITPSWLGIVVVLAIYIFPGVPGLILKTVRFPARFPLSMHAQSVAEFTGQLFFETIFALVVLPYEAFSNLDAILRSCWRMLITKRKLLQWTVSAKAKRNNSSLWTHFQLMAAAPIFAVALGVILYLQGRLDTLPLLGVWLLSPVLPWWISRPRVSRMPSFSVEDKKFIRKISRKTWRYYETFAGPEDNWLPADNYQEEPREATAHYTSPTNIGLMLLSNLGAYDMGYICTGLLVDKTRAAFKTMEKLTRFRGHFFNWYDTTTLQPLAPNYVSTVDSGNLAGYLLTLRVGLLNIKKEPLFRRNFFKGLSDTIIVIEDLLLSAREKTVQLSHKFSGIIRELDLLSAFVNELEKTPAGLKKSLENVRCVITMVHNIQHLTLESETEVQWWFDALEDQCVTQQNELLYLSPWLANDLTLGVDPKIRQALDVNRTPEEMEQVHECLSSLQKNINGTSTSSSEQSNELRHSFIVLVGKIQEGIDRSQERIKELEQMAGQCQTLADQDYEFLYDTSRNLLVIGYDVSKRRQDESCYDLLASESRLGSFVGIAQGKLPVEHWFSLGRLIAIRHGQTFLLSWGGSMFEYLMPQLIMPGYNNTLLGQTCKAIVVRQIDYGRKQGVPWGISESAENCTDANLKYQYRSFGVPELGFKRGLASDLVIAPYASALALMIKPVEACENMQRMTALGYEGKYGFYEAIDYTANRSSHEHSPSLIRSYMSHHQGMSFISMVNFFTDNCMVKRFENDPLFSATTLLLQERVPKTAPFRLVPSSLFKVQTAPAQEDLLRIFTTPHSTIPEVHILSNGRYHVMISNAGGGYSRWLDLAVTRWNEDITLDNRGSFVYVNDLSNKNLWSAAFQPTCAEPKKYEAIFSQARAEFRRRDRDTDTYTEIAVSPEDDIEIRRISLSDLSGKPRRFELTSFAEVVLAPPASDMAHPVFSNLFVQTEILESHHAILCTRRPRSPHDASPWMFHIFTVHDFNGHTLSYETDRLTFVGRDLTTRNCAAIKTLGSLSATQGPVLDPIVSIRCGLTLGAWETTTGCFISGMASTRDEAIALIEKYQDWRMTERVFDMAVVHGKVMLRQLNATEADAQLFGRLSGSILYSSRYRRADPSILLKNTRGQAALWAYGISGDLPIVLLRIGDPSRIELAAKLIQAHAYWRLKGLPVDLVIWNEERTGYRQEFRDQLVGLIAASPEASFLDRKGGVFLRHPDQMSEEDQILMLATARIVFLDTEGTFIEQVQRILPADVTLPRLPFTRRIEKGITEPENFRQSNLHFFNGWGGFTRDGREYIIQIKPRKPTPMPWVNVVANRQFGTVISQGGGYTWFENAHEFRLTPWYNDPVSDRSGEAVYIRDENSGQFWSATPQPAPGAGDYLNRHGYGYSVFEYTQYALKSELWIYVDIDAPVKFWMLKVRNDSSSVRKVSATGFLEIVLGEHRAKTQMHIRTGIDSKTGALLASNPFNTEFADRVAYFTVNDEHRSCTGDRTEFIGRNGSLSDPAALHRPRLSGKVGVGLDPAAALQVYFELNPGEEKEIVFTLGVGRGIEETRSLIQRFSGLQAAHAARDRVWQYWNHTLGTINIETPDTALNLITNGWLMYQIISARLWARSGFYQSGGAFGFRDQLQDVMALVHAQPGLVREHLMLCASRQFTQGDVQHWWHPPQGRGVRTLISDDLLWLPYVTSHYVVQTGDTGVLDETVHYLESRLLNPGEESYYDLPGRSSEKETLYEHCKRAIQHALRFGSHGLPLMGSGDWNDGMNLVGIKGEGESVWLAFFLYSVLDKFAVLARKRGDTTFDKLCDEQSRCLKRNIESSAWDGEWYKRAYFDDGTELGSAKNLECKIDATVQIWSVLSGAGDPVRSKQAMSSLAHSLIDHDFGLIKLLDPPFDTSSLEPGYIKGYVPGIRENGGQYTHAAVWAVMAFALQGDTQRVKELLSMINPVNHGSTPDKIKRYLVEPYVMAADIYGVQPHCGRGGWTWYTGSASWMYRLIIETVIGLQLKANTLTFNPCIPEEWEHFKIHYRFRETVYHLAFVQVQPKGEITVLLDDTEQQLPQIEMVDDRQEHFAEITIGRKENA
jgi:cellobiose phosphorylase